LSNFHIRKVAVLGAGVMGAQIAAHLTNANVQTVLFELPAKEGPKNGVVMKAIDGMMKLSPDPFAVKSKAASFPRKRFLRRTRRACRLPNCRRCFQKHCGTASAAFTSLIRRVT